MIIRGEEERVKKTIVRSEPVVSYAVAQNSRWSNKESYRGNVARRKTCICSTRKKRKTWISPLNVELPEEILVEILARLPPKPLWRFSCVSKQWKSIVWDPKFARNYLKLGSRGMLYPYMEYTPHRPDMGFSGWSSKKLFVPDHHHRVLFYFRTTWRRNDRRILASSNGLVLSQIHTTDFCLITRPFHNISLCVSNPLTRQNAILHETCVPICFESTPAPLMPWTCGFATRATTKINGSYRVSYKVVLVLPPEERVLDPAKYSSIQIFSSDIGRWKCVPGPVSVPRVVLRNGYKAQDFCYKGILHWVDQEGGTRTIVTYNPYKSPKRFGHIRMPQNASGQILSSSLMSLVHMGHEDDFPRCCEIERCPGDSSLSLLVWRMADYDKQLWCLEQRCAISPDSLQLLRGCRQLVCPDPRNPPGVFCYLFVRWVPFRVVAIDLRSGKEEDVDIGNMVSGRRHLYYPPCGTLPLVPFMFCPWSSPLYHNYRYPMPAPPPCQIPVN